jgi:hypothetical protein
VRVAVHAGGGEGFVTVNSGGHSATRWHAAVSAALLASVACVAWFYTTPWLEDQARNAGGGAWVVLAYIVMLATPVLMTMVLCYAFTRQTMAAVAIGILLPPLTWFVAVYLVFALTFEPS